MLLHRCKPLLPILLMTLGSASLAVPCADFAARLPNVRRELCEAARLESAAVRSVKGRILWLRDIKPEQADLRVLVVAAMHGDELSSAAVAFHWIGLAAQMPVAGARQIHWRFVPVLNPDGVFNRSPRRVNAHGVDLNRNFATPNWERDSKLYWEKGTRKDPRRWPGPKPLSEPESRFLHDQIRDFKPQLVVSIHAPYGVLDFDGPVVPPQRLGSLYLHQLGIFPGSLGNYGGIQSGVPVVTIELPNATRTPRDTETRQMWQDLLRWIDARLPRRPNVVAAQRLYLDSKLLPAAPTAE